MRLSMFNVGKPRGTDDAFGMSCVLLARTMLLLCLLPPGIASASNLAIVNATVYPSPTEAPVADAVVLIQDGVITAVGSRDDVGVPPGFAIVDRQGKFVTAGFWNSHVHLTTPALLDAAKLSDPALGKLLTAMFTRYGFTTVFDIASSTQTAVHIKRRVSDGNVDGPRILTVGDPFYPPGGTPVYVIEAYRAAGLPLPEVTSAAAGAARVAHQHKAGADGVKTFTGAIVGGAHDVVPMPPEYMRAITDKAHELAMPVFAHPTSRRGLEIAVNNGTDILAHAAPLAGTWPRSFAMRLKQRNVAMIPTLALFLVHADPSTPIETALQQVEALHAAGGDILFGTDVGFIDAADATREFELLGKVMSWREVLATLTTVPARRFGEGNRRGRIATGYIADLVVLNEDPAADVGAFSHVHETLRDGHFVFRSSGEYASGRNRRMSLR